MSAYHDACAMTGLKIINGGERSEAQAAHIRSAEYRGPDSAMIAEEDDDELGDLEDLPF